MPLAGHDTMATYIAKNADGISIHVPLAGHDHSSNSISGAASISIHVPLAGHDMIASPDATAED